MPEEPSESSDLSSDAAVLGLDDSDLDPEPEIAGSSTPTESPSEEEEGEAESKEVAPEPAKGESEEGEESAEPVLETPPDSTPTETFKFLDKEYASVKDAEHAWKSYLGQVSAKERQVEELTGLLKQINDRIEASESQKGDVPAQPKGEPREEPKSSSIFDAIDFEALEEEVEARGLRSGMEYLVYQVDKQLSTMKDDIRQEMMGNIAPFQAWQEQLAEFNESFGYFSDLSKRVTEEGEPLYPELVGSEAANQEFTERVAHRWLNTFTPEERKRLGAYGAHIAYVLQKADEGVSVGAAPPAPPPPEPESKASEAFDRLNRQTNQGLGEGVLTGSSSVKPTSRRTSNDIVNQELEEYGEQMREPILGI